MHDRSILKKAKKCCKSKQTHRKLYRDQTVPVAYVVDNSKYLYIYKYILSHLLNKRDRILFITLQTINIVFVNQSKLNKYKNIYSKIFNVYFKSLLALLVNTLSINNLKGNPLWNYAIIVFYL